MHLHSLLIELKILDILMKGDFRPMIMFVALVFVVIIIVIIIMVVMVVII